MLSMITDPRFRADKKKLPGKLPGSRIIDYGYLTTE